MVGVEEDREIVFLADDRSDLSNTDESPLTPSEVPISTGISSRRAAAATEFSPTRSETLKCPMAAPLQADPTGLSQRLVIAVFPFRVR